MKLKLLLFFGIFSVAWASPFDLTSEEKPKTDELMTPLEAFEKKKEAKISILDIKNGKKFEIILLEGEKKFYKNLELQLLNSWQEKNNFYSKITLAEITINFSDYKISSLLPKLVENDYLISIACH